MRYLILGCGWVGEYVAKLWLKEGHEVWASTTTKEKYHRLVADGIFVFEQNFDRQATIPTDLPKAFDFILVSIPATHKFTLEELRHRFLHVSLFLQGLTYRKVIFLSSIGIYPDVSKEIDEYTFPEEELQEKLLLAEKVMSQFPNRHIYRLGGLFGQSRIFAKYFQNKVCTTGGQLANFIHIEDVANLITQGFDGQLTQEIYNVVAPEHPLKKEVILASALKYGFELPSSFDDQDSFQKVVTGERLQNDLNYTFNYKSPLDF
ncbi:GDP-L-fucose synthase [Sphingobacterium sp. SRCM116780]|uniref:GDP-L-fucose synthase n=1 Tax=Sphingobacterium sp. SRCM116780 TaxID=2907623 RepID=UPI001F1F0668|nr:GDP-L-fucose synthase [Sphingobacterium sp. SRCM116780]UIR57166.1 GDP-L-fucose synthase [Sphingobacterium sp. SRCM116780]